MAFAYFSVRGKSSKIQPSGWTFVTASSSALIYSSPDGPPAPLPLAGGAFAPLAAAPLEGSPPAALAASNSANYSRSCSSLARFALISSILASSDLS